MLLDIIEFEISPFYVHFILGQSDHLLIWVVPCLFQ